MKHQQIVKLIDLLSFLALVAMMVTGLLIEYSLPPGSGRGELLGLTRHGWGEWHYYASLLFLALISTHLFTHRGFIKAVIMGRRQGAHGYRIWLALAAAIVLALFVLAMVIG